MDGQRKRAAPIAGRPAMARAPRAGASPPPSSISSSPPVSLPASPPPSSTSSSPPVSLPASPRPSPRPDRVVAEAPARAAGAPGSTTALPPPSPPPPTCYDVPPTCYDVREASRTPALGLVVASTALPPPPPPSHWPYVPPPPSHWPVLIADIAHARGERAAAARAPQYEDGTPALGLVSGADAHGLVQLPEVDETARRRATRPPAPPTRPPYHRLYIDCGRSSWLISY